MAFSATLPARNSASEPAWRLLLLLTFFGLLITAVVCLFAGAAWSLWIATATGVVGFVIGLAGGIVDHDPEPYFAYEVTVFPLLLIVTVAVLRRRTR